MPAGRTLALVSETGAGKSTLAKLVARFYDPQRGVVRIDGHDLREVTQESLRRQLGIVPQEFLFGGTVRDNIAFGRPEATDVEIAAAARRWARTTSSCGCRRATRTTSASAAAGCPPASASSALARALIADPRILILDEATANVDVHAEAAIEQGLRRLLAGRGDRHCPPAFGGAQRRPDRGAGERRDRRDRHATN